MSQKANTLRGISIASIAVIVLSVGGILVFNNNTTIENDVSFLTDLESRSISQDERAEACEAKINEWNSVIDRYQGLIKKTDENMDTTKRLYEQSRGAKKQKWRDKLETLNRDIVIYRNAIYRYEGLIDKCEDGAE